MNIDIRLENFTGPLDLLLHLIKSREMDIYDIRIVEITEQYLDIIDQMKQLDLDVAGEFLLMAATLIHIKSRLLLPVNDELEVEEEDPRAELVRRLLEYQRYKDAAAMFQQLPQLERDVFSSHFSLANILDDNDVEDDVAVGVYQLAAAFHRLLQDKPPEVFHDVIREPLSVADYVKRICEKMALRNRLPLSEIFAEKLTRSELIVTFLATLELVKLRLIKIDQANACSEIWLTLAAPPDQLAPLLPERDFLTYG